MNKTNSKKIKKARRHKRVRSKISGTKERPRLSVFKSNRSVYAQIIDDREGKTLVSAYTRSSSGKTKVTKNDAAKTVGENIAKRAIEKGIKEVVYDRSGYAYNGMVKVIAESARAVGLKF